MRSSTIRPITRAPVLALAVTAAHGATAQEADLEEVIITGTRLADRSPADSPVPADVISGSDMRVNGSTDIQDMLRTQVPSFDIILSRSVTPRRCYDHPICSDCRRIACSCLLMASGAIEAPLSLSLAAASLMEHRAST